MKKTNFFILTFLLISISTISNGQLISATDSVIVSGSNSGNFEGAGRGFRFTPNSDLYLTELGKRVAAAPGNYTWVIWNSASQTVVHQQASTSNTAAVYTYEPISAPVQLLSGVSYDLMLYCDNTTGATYYYGSSTQVNSNLTYGGAAVYCNSCTPTTYPTGTVANYHYGTPDFHFSLTPCNATSSSFSVTECAEYTVPSGDETYNFSGTQTVMDTIPNSCGGDSLMTINLTINPMPDTTTAVSMVTITSGQVGGTYQWIDCGNGNSFITGATNDSYSATANGDYAVIVTLNGCSDTSACVNISTVGIDDNKVDFDVKLSPNPTTGNVIVDLGAVNDANISITNITGEKVFQMYSENERQVKISLNDFSKGVYFVNIQGSNHKEVIKLIKQ
jgi:hypothetical protein